MFTRGRRADKRWRLIGNVSILRLTNTSGVWGLHAAPIPRRRLWNYENWIWIAEPHGSLFMLVAQGRAGTRVCSQHQMVLHYILRVICAVWNVGGAGRMFVNIRSQTLSLASALYDAILSAWKAKVILDWRAGERYSTFFFCCWWNPFPVAHLLEIKWFMFTLE